jgi:branched-subunit amino acid ABC-type transport system permease component
MEAEDYRLAWIVYVCAGVVLNLLIWRTLERHLLRDFAYLVQCVLLALVFTPFWVLEDGSQRVMAPALIVFLMDAITLEPKAGIRALIPLVLSLAVALLVALLLSATHRWRRRR